MTGLPRSSPSESVWSGVTLSVNSGAGAPRGRIWAMGVLSGLEGHPYTLTPVAGRGARSARDRLSRAVRAYAVEGALQGDAMPDQPCAHIEPIKEVKTPRARQCDECVLIGSTWVHLRTCQTCGG